MGIPSHNKPTVLCRGTGKKTLGGSFQAFCDQLSDCFHQEGDLQNEIREMATPSQNEIISNLNNLKEDFSLGTSLGTVILCVQEVLSNEVEI